MKNHKPTITTKMDNLQNVHALLFDLGGVILDIDWGKVFLAWSENSHLNSAEIADRFKMDETYQKHECGLISWDEYFIYLSNLIEYYGDQASFKQGWNSIFVGLIDETAHILSQINSELPLYLLTNTNMTHERLWRVEFSSVICQFNSAFVSSTMGYRKPDRRAFEHSLEIMNVEPNKVLFFDDTQENVDAAITTGLKAVHVKQPADIRIALDKCDLLE